MPATSQKVDLVVGVDAAFQMERQMQIQQGCRRTRTCGGALFGEGLFRSGIGAEARGAADGAILSFKLPVEHDLCGGIIADFFISQERYQALLQGPKAALDLAFGLRAGSDQMGHAQGGEGALKLGTGIPIIGHGIMAKKAEAIGIDGQGYAVL